LASLLLPETIYAAVNQIIHDAYHYNKSLSPKAADMAYRLIIDGNSVYEIDEECERNRSGAGAQQVRQGRQRKQVRPFENKGGKGKHSL
jgi:hypothetical protein